MNKIILVHENLSKKNFNTPLFLFPFLRLALFLDPQRQRVSLGLWDTIFWPLSCHCHLHELISVYEVYEICRNCVPFNSKLIFDLNSRSQIFYWSDIFTTGILWVCILPFVVFEQNLAVSKHLEILLLLKDRFRTVFPFPVVRFL